MRILSDVCSSFPYKVLNDCINVSKQNPWAHSFQVQQTLNIA